ncbi:MAG: choice-of-anchor L domain-containing protein [Bacteroidales bacterium]
MKKILVLIAFLIPFFGHSQVACTSQSGQNVQSIIENYFIGGGVEVSNVRFNGQLVANSNQFGTFTNVDTSGQNVKLSSGLVIVTGDIQDAAAGTYGVHSSLANPISEDLNIAMPLYNLLLSQGNTYDLNDIGVLSFDFIPQGNEVSFKYVFASDEYPSFVCSTYNDAFGFFVSGPYLNDGITPANVPGISPLSNFNIATIPNSDPELPVTINTINSSTSPGSVTPCILTNSHLHIQQSSGSPINKMQGYTIALETKRIIVAPCKKYSISISICDVSDNSYNSAVYLGANSFKTDAVELNGNPSGPQINDTLLKASCSSTTIRAKLNRPATAYDQYTFQVFGDMVENIDYEPFGNQLTFPEGDSIAEVTIHFRTDPSDVPGDIKTMKIISENTTPCSVMDTIIIKTIVPEVFEFSFVRNDTVYCNDVLPQRELLSAEAINGIVNTTYLWTGPDGLPIGETPNSSNNYVTITNPITITITATDECYRQISKNISFSVNTGTTEVSADKDKICEGDSIQLSCTNAVTCIWTSIPADLKLAQNSTLINPIAMPSSQTIYMVTINDMYGCEAKGQISITAYPNVEAKMSLNPNKLTYIDSQTRFMNLTSNSHSVFWDLGDGTTTTEENGYHNYPNDHEGEYDVMLIAFNEALCPDTAMGKIIVKPDFTIYLPNSFTPGTGDINSIFMPFTSIPIKYELSIFNLWGENIFTTNNEIGGGWNGKLKNGSYAQDGTYVWYLVYKDGDGLNQKKKGNVAVIGSPK